MGRFELGADGPNRLATPAGRVVMVTQTAERAAAIHWETRLFSRPAAPAPAAVRTSSVTVDDLVEEARATYQRISPRAAYQLVLHGRAVLVDIRPEAQRRAEGEVDPALRPVVIERNVLEWRLDPRSTARLPWVVVRDAGPRPVPGGVCVVARRRDAGPARADPGDGRRRRAARLARGGAPARGVRGRLSVASTRVAVRRCRAADVGWTTR